MTVVDTVEYVSANEWRRWNGLPELALIAVGDGITIDNLGRHWDPAKHPRGRDGRFIEVGGLVKVWDELNGGRVFGVGDVTKIDNAGIHVRFHTVNNPADNHLVGTEQVFNKSQISTIPQGQVRLDRNGNLHPHDRELPDMNGKLMRHGDRVRTAEGHEGHVHLVGEDGRVAIKRDDGKIAARKVEHVERLDHPNHAQVRPHEKAVHDAHAKNFSPGAAAPRANSAKAPSEPDAPMGYVMKQPWGGGPPQRVRVTGRSDDIKNGRPGFEGVIVGGPDDGQSTWGYDDQIVGVEPPKVKTKPKVAEASLPAVKKPSSPAVTPAPAPAAPNEPGAQRELVAEALDRQGFGAAARHAVRHGSSDEAKQAIAHDPAMERLRQRNEQNKWANVRQRGQLDQQRDLEQLDRAVKHGVEGPRLPAPTPNEHIARVNKARELVKIRADQAQRARAPGRDIRAAGAANGALRKAREDRQRAEEDAAHAGVNVPDDAPVPPSAPAEPAKLPVIEQMLRRAASDAGVPEELHGALMADIGRPDGPQTELGKAYKARNVAHSRVTKAKENLAYRKRELAAIEKVQGKDSRDANERRAAILTYEQDVRRAEADVPAADKALHDAVQNALGNAQPQPAASAPAETANPATGVDLAALQQLHAEFPKRLNDSPRGASPTGQRAYWHAGFAIGDAINTKDPELRKKALDRAEKKLQVATNDQVPGAQRALEQLRELRNTGPSGAHSGRAGDGVPTDLPPIVDNQYGPSSIPDDIRKIDTTDLQRAAPNRGDKAVIGNYDVQRTGGVNENAEQGNGINTTWILTDQTTGRKFVVKHDDRAAEVGAEAEVNAAAVMRTSGVYGASYVEVHPTDKKAIISTFVGEQNGVKKRTIAGSDRRSPQTIYKNMADPNELVRARVLNYGLVNFDRHEGNAIWGQDAAGKDHLLLFDHGLALNPGSDTFRPHEVVHMQDKSIYGNKLAYGRELSLHFRDLGRDASVAKIIEEAQMLLAAASSMPWQSDDQKQRFIRRIQEVLDNPGALHDSIVRHY